MPWCSSPQRSYPTLTQSFLNACFDHSNRVDICCSFQDLNDWSLLVLKLNPGKVSSPPLRRSRTLIPPASTKIVSVASTATLCKYSLLLQVTPPRKTMALSKPVIFCEWNGNPFKNMIPADVDFRSRSPPCSSVNMPAFVVHCRHSWSVLTCRTIRLSLHTESRPCHELGIGIYLTQIWTSLRYPHSASPSRLLPRDHRCPMPGDKVVSCFSSQLPPSSLPTLGRTSYLSSGRVRCFEIQVLSSSTWSSGHFQLHMHGPSFFILSTWLNSFSNHSQSSVNPMSSISSMCTFMNIWRFWCL